MHDQKIDARSPSPALAGAISLYDVLHVRRSAAPVVVEAAYRALRQAAMTAQPCAAGLSVAELERAYTILADPRRRMLYDLELAGLDLPELELIAESPPRLRTCWRCGQVISPLGTYCGMCRWTRCGSCSACGCDHPTWRARRSSAARSRWLDRGRTGLLLAAVMLGSALGSAAVAEPEQPARRIESAAFHRPAAKPSAPVLLPPTTLPAVEPAPAPEPESSRPASLLEAFRQAARALAPGSR